MAIAKCVENDGDWFGDWSDQYDGIACCFAIFTFCGNEHLTILTESCLAKPAQQAVLKRVKRFPLSLETGHRHLFEDRFANVHERDYDEPHTLVLEPKNAI